MRTVTALLGMLALQSAAAAQQENYVTRTEFEKLQAAYDKLAQELHALKDPAQAAAADEKEKELEDIQTQLDALRKTVDVAKPGSTDFVLTGYGAAGFVKRKDEPSTFSTTFNPIFLWKIDQRTFFEGELEFEAEDGEFKAKLEYAELTYLVNDYVTIGAGRFLAPFGTWAERFHPAWINELPDAPLALSHDGGIAPTSLDGLQLRGGLPLGAMKLNYAFYLANGPSLVTDDPGLAGSLDFEAPTDLNNNKSIGGRVGFLPIPALEIGYSNLFARVDPDGSDVGNVDAELQSVDLAYARDVAPLKGALKVRSQWAWSSVDDATYDSTGALGFGPLQVNNNMSSGGYAQVAYRPSQVQSETLKKFEFVVRYDDLELPSSAPRNIDERRWTFGVDYWVNSSTVFKLAYQLDDTDDPAGIEGNRDAVLFQAAMGF